MADTVRSAIPVTQALTVGDRIWQGMDTYTDPNKLQDGFAQRITNLVVRNGSLVPRNGITKRSTTARGGSFHSSVAVRSASNKTSSAVLVSQATPFVIAGSNASAQFWKYDINWANPLPIPMSQAGTTTLTGIHAPRVCMAQFGRYVYVAPGKSNTATDSVPYRIDVNTSSTITSAVTILENRFLKAGHSFVVGDPIVLVASSGQAGLPAGLQLNTVYYVSHVAGNEFYVSTSLPTTTTTSVSRVAFSASATTVTIATTFKGEPIPTATGLTEIMPVAEAFPFVAKSIPTSNVFDLATVAISLSNTNQLLTNGNFSGSNDTEPAGWTQFVTSDLREVTIFTGSDRPTPSSGAVALFDGDSDNGLFPGLYQDVNVVGETTALYNGTVSATCLIYKLRVRLCHYEQLSSGRRRTIALRVIGLKQSGGSYIPVEGATISELVELRENGKVKDAWTEVEVTADFRDFKDQITSTGKIRVELQLQNNVGYTGAGKEGLYVDYAYLHAHASAPSTVSTDTDVDVDTRLVRMRATSFNTNTTNVAGYVRDRSFYYNLASSATVNLSTTGTHTLVGGTLPENGSPVSFAAVGASGLVVNKTYFLINRSGSTFQLATARNGTRLLTSANAAGLSMNVGMYLQNAEFVSCQFYLPPTFENQNPTFTIGLQHHASTGTSTAVTWGGKGTIDPVNRYLTFDMSTFDKALLEHVRAIYIRCDNDFFVSNQQDATVVSSPTILFYIGRLVYNGELQNQGQYQYAFTRWKAAPAYTTSTTQIQFQARAPWTLTGTTSSYHGGIESSLSKASVAITASNAESRIKLTLSASDFKDAAGDGYTHLLVYRRNNTAFPDGRFRLLGQVDISGATPVLASVSSNLSLDSSTTATQIVLVDNVGDTEMLFDKPIGQTGYVYRDGKDFFPTGCQTIAIHQQRLWMSKANTLFASWLLDNDNEYALHTTLVPVVGDPYLPVKGASFDVSGQFDYEHIVAMVPFSGEGISKNNSTSNALLVLRNNSILPVIGSDASSFTVLGFVREPGAGCIAPMCATTIGGRVWWLSMSGIMQYTNGLPVKMSQPLDKLVNARGFNPLTDPNGLDIFADTATQRTSSAVVFDNKFLFTSGQPNSALLDTIFVYDPQIQGWYEWSFPKDDSQNQIQPKSMFVFNTDTDAPELYILGDNGHVYGCTGMGHDMAESTPTPFKWAVLTRQYGQTYAQGRAYYAQNRVHELDLHIETQNTLNVNWKIYNDEQPQLVSTVFNPAPNAFVASGTWSFTAGNRAVAIRNIKRDMRGTTYSVELSGDSLEYQYFRIYGILLQVAEGGVRRQN